MTSSSSPSSTFLFNDDFLLTTSTFDSFQTVPIERVKSFWDNQPCNINHSSQTFGSKVYFEEVEKKKYFVEPHVPLFAEFSCWKGKKVLELGCGIGTESINFAKYGADLTVIDISPRSIEICKQRFQIFGFTAQFLVGNIEELDQFLPKDSKFDLIWAFGVLHHTPFPEKVVQQLQKFLHPEGELRAMVYSKVSYKLFFLMRETGMWDFSKMDQLISWYSEAQSACPISYTWTFDEIKSKLFPPESFHILEMKKKHIFPYKIAEYKKHIYEKEDCWKNVPPALWDQLEAELGWHTLIRVKLKLSHLKEIHSNSRTFWVKKETDREEEAIKIQIPIDHCIYDLIQIVFLKISFPETVKEGDLFIRKLDLQTPLSNKLLISNLIDQELLIVSWKRQRI